MKITALCISLVSISLKSNTMLTCNPLVSISVKYNAVFTCLHLHYVIIVQCLCHWCAATFVSMHLYVQETIKYLFILSYIILLVFVCYLTKCWIHIWTSFRHANIPINYSDQLFEQANQDLGLYSLSGWTSLWSLWNLEVARFRSLLNFIGTSAAVLPRCLSNFRMIRSLYHLISRPQDFTRVGRTRLSL